MTAASLEFATGVKVRVISRKVAKLAGSHGEPAHDVCVGCLSISDRKAGVDLQRLAAGMTCVGLDECVVNALQRGQLRGPLRGGSACGSTSTLGISCGHPNPPKERPTWNSF